MALTTGQITIVDNNDSTNLSLSRDTIPIMFTADGITGTYDSSLYVTASVLVGGVDDSSNWTFSASTTNVSCTASNNNRTQTVNSGSLSAEYGYIDFTATKNGASSLTKRCTVFKQKQGNPAVSGYLTNETEGISTAADGSYATMTAAGGRFVVLDNNVEVNTATFSVNSSTSQTKNGLTLTIGASSGVYTLSGTSWSTDSESFTLQAVYNSTTITKVYTLTKSKNGQGIVLSATKQNFTALDDVLEDPSDTITVTATLNNVSGNVAWTALDPNYTSITTDILSKRPAPSLDSAEIAHSMNGSFDTWTGGVGTAPDGWSIYETESTFTVTTISPTSIAGNTPTVITITGTNFTSNVGISYWNGNVTTVFYDSATQIRCTVTGNNAVSSGTGLTLSKLITSGGIHGVKVNTPAITVTSGTTAPTITAVSPATVYWKPTTTITLTGTNITASPTLGLSGVTGTISLSSYTSTSITANITPTSSGIGTISVNVGGRIATTTIFVSPMTKETSIVSAGSTTSFGWNYPSSYSSISKGISRTDDFRASPLPANSILAGSVDYYISSRTSGTPGILVRIYYDNTLTTPCEDFQILADTSILNSWQTLRWKITLASSRQMYGIRFFPWASWTGMTGGLFVGTCYIDNLKYSFYNSSSSNFTSALNIGYPYIGIDKGKIYTVTSMSPLTWATTDVNTASAYGTMASRPSSGLTIGNTYHATDSTTSLEIGKTYVATSSTTWQETPIIPLIVSGASSEIAVITASDFNARKQATIRGTINDIYDTTSIFRLDRTVTLTADKIKSGTIDSKTITLNSTSSDVYITAGAKTGLTDETNPGLILGKKISNGNPALLMKSTDGSYLNWDGSTLKINGQITLGSGSSISWDNITTTGNLGGANLVTGSSTSTGWSGYTAFTNPNTFTKISALVSESYIFSAYFTCAGNIKITLSFEGYADTNVSTVDVFVLPDNFATIGLVSAAGYAKSSTWKSYSMTFTTPAGWGAGASVRVRFDHNGSTGGSATIGIRNVKVEYGTVATPWSPAVGEIPKSTYIDANGLYTGTVVADKILSGTIDSKTITLDSTSSDVYLKIGAKTGLTDTTNTGLILGKKNSDGNSVLLMKSAGGNFLNWDGTNLNISGNITMNSGSIAWGTVAVPTQANMGNWATKIDSTGVYTGTIVANQITARSDLTNLVTTSDFVTEGPNPTATTALTWAGAYSYPQVQSTSGHTNPPRAYCLVTNSRTSLETKMFSVTPGEILSVSVWADTTQALFGSTFGIWCRNDANADIAGVTIPLISTGKTWAYYQNTITVPAGARHAFAYFYMDGNASLNNTPSMGYTRWSDLKISRQGKVTTDLLEAGLAKITTLMIGSNQVTIPISTYLPISSTFEVTTTPKTLLQIPSVPTYDSGSPAIAIKYSIAFFTELWIGLNSGDTPVKTMGYQARTNFYDNGTTIVEEPINKYGMTLTLYRTIWGRQFYNIDEYPNTPASNGGVYQWNSTTTYTKGQRVYKFYPGASGYYTWMWYGDWYYVWVPPGPDTYGTTVYESKADSNLNHDPDDQATRGSYWDIIQSAIYPNAEKSFNIADACEVSYDSSKTNNSKYTLRINKISGSPAIVNLKKSFFGLTGLQR